MPRALDVFFRFLLLGCASFGGPAAHVGYFRREFVEQRRWLDDEHFARLIALTQFLPGPGSSQLGFAIGLHRAGFVGAVAAFIGFTLPSFAMMLALATSIASMGDHRFISGAIDGLKILAVVVVADACLGMYQSFCGRRSTAVIAFLSAFVLVVVGGIAMQLGVMIGAALTGAFVLRPARTLPDDRIVAPAWVPLLLFGAFFAAGLLVPASGLAAIGADFYLAGSVVFGGGHVVLPVLEDLVASEMSRDAFLTGYAAAQAVPGPMFTLATFLGAGLFPASPVAGAAVATGAIFLPGFLLVLALNDSWHRLATQPHVAGATAGINAAVVGLLLAALYDPVIVSGLETDIDVGLAILGFLGLRIMKINIAILVIAMTIAGILLTTL